MDADERLTALKRAYAEIILNTAKEAAARIMVSERKASRFEYELKSAKEDAIRMLLRLKQMMDLQIKEAAIVSCSQQKKIDELEAQLQEAEDIVEDLREELRALEAQLARFSQRKEVNHTVHVNNAPTHETVTSPPLEVQQNSNIDQTNKSQRLYTSLLPIKKLLIGDLPSIILRSKETELYKNGCTQRIRACEYTPPNVKSPFSEETNDLNANTKLESISKEGEVLLDREIVLEQVKEIDLAADNSCLTSPSSVRHTNDTTTDENLARTCNSQSTSGEEVTPVEQEKEEVNLPSVSTVSKICNTNEVPSSSSTDRVIKYTFQRKRKRGALIDGSGTTEQSPEKQTLRVGPVKVRLIGESTPEKISLDQVACQKIDSNNSSQGDQEKSKAADELDRALCAFNHLIASFLSSYTPLQINKHDLGSFNISAIINHIFECAKHHNRTEDERSSDVFDMIVIGLHRGNITQDQFARTDFAGVLRIKQLASMYKIPIRSSARETIQLQEDTITFVRAATCFPSSASSMLYRKIGVAKNGAKTVLASEQLPDAMKHYGFFGLIPKGCYPYLKKAYLFAHAAYMVDLGKMIDPNDTSSLKELAAGALNRSKDAVEKGKSPDSDEFKVGWLRVLGLTDPCVFKKIVEVCNNLCKVVGEPELRYETAEKYRVKNGTMRFFKDPGKNVAADVQTKHWGGILSVTGRYNYSTTWHYSTTMLSVARVLPDLSTSVD